MPSTAKWFDLKWFTKNKRLVRQKIAFTERLGQLLDHRITHIKVSGKIIEFWENFASRPMKAGKEDWKLTRTFSLHGSKINVLPKAAIEDPYVYAVARKFKYLTFIRLWTRISMWHSYAYLRVCLIKKGKALLLRTRDLSGRRMDLPPDFFFTNVSLGKMKQLLNLKQFGPTVLSKNAEKALIRLASSSLTSKNLHFLGRDNIYTRLYKKPRKPHPKDLKNILKVFEGYDFPLSINALKESLEVDRTIIEKCIEELVRQKKLKPFETPGGILYELVENV